MRDDTKKQNMFNRIYSFISLGALVVGMVAAPLAAAPTAFAATPNWNTTGSYVIDMQYQGSDNSHDMHLTQDGSGNLTGNGGSPAGANTYTWVINSGTVDADSINFTANYTATADAVTPQTVLTVSGTIAPDGTMSGTWSDNYQGGARTGDWHSTSGNAVAIETPSPTPTPSPSPSPTPSPTPATVKVTVDKYIDDAPATAVDTNSASFQMSSTWSADNIGAGTGTYALGPTGFNSTNAYEAVTADMTSGASYSTNEILDGTVVGATCSVASTTPTTPAYTLVGYKTGDTLSDALAASTTATVPAFTEMESDKYVLVINHDCNAASSGGTIGGTVSGSNGVLHVDSITTDKGDATADGTFGNGWRYTFHITVPNNEPNLQMKFADWFNSAASSTIPVANNMRISSAQANNAGATVLLTAANTYSTPALTMTGDTNTSLAGKQVDVVVEVAVPSTTVDGSYSTSYGVKTQ